jgi:hypothetical protein
MAQKLIFLDYTFMFDSNTPFAHLYEFENLLAKFFDQHDLVAENIKSIEGSLAKRVMYITKKEITLIPDDPKPQGRPQTLKGKIKELSDRKFRKPALQFMKGK